MSITIGIPIRNAFHCIKPLLRSLDRHTDKKLVEKLVIVDDGSKIPLRNMRFDFDIFSMTKHFRNDISRGFPSSCNFIISEANTRYVCILNSDVVVTPNWLNYLYEAMESHSDSGIAGPSTSYANDPQCRRDICGKRFVMTESEIINYAKNLKNVYKDVVDIGSVLTGFCMLIRKSVIDMVGSFDEQFGLGSFEEADLCKRMINAGFKCLWVPYAYVHHYGKGTFGSEKIDWRKIWAKNQKRFEEKWKNE